MTPNKGKKTRNNKMSKTREVWKNNKTQNLSFFTNVSFTQNYFKL